jgi:glutathione S-transferase
MKLYSLAASPFAARVHMLLRAKGAEIAVLTPPAPAEFRAITPMGKVPALVLDDGSLLPESEVICGYLDAVLPGPRLYPQTPAAQAKVALIVRLVDLYVAPAMHDFFALLFTDPTNRDAVAALLPSMGRGLKYLDHYLARDGFAAGADFSQADCALAPMLLYVAEVLPPVTGEALLDRRPALLAYWQRIQTHPAARPVLDDIRAALKKYQAMLQKMQAQQQ